MRTPRPDAINTRPDALQLWAHLLDRGVQFDVEADPAEWCDVEGRQALNVRDIATFRRLVAEVDRLGAVTFECYADAERLRAQTPPFLALPRAA
jgi:hypothetical protein